MSVKQTLNACNHWIFDLDGTLTNSVHDFGHIRKELGLPESTPILEALKAMPAQQSATLWDKLNELELFYASRASVMQGVIPVLERLCARGAQLAILTRNTMPVVMQTLETCGLDQYFPKQHILDRDAFEPKPSPQGILHLLEQWQVQADKVVMVGDYLFDLQAGKSAGVVTVHIDLGGAFPWPELSDFCVRSFKEIMLDIT